MKSSHWLIFTCLIVLSACSGNSNPEITQNSPPEAEAPAVAQPNTPSDAGPGKEQETEATSPEASPPNLVVTPGKINPVGQVNPQYSASLANINLAGYFKKTLIHNSQCQWRGSQRWSGQGQSDFYSESTYLCPVDLPAGARVSKVKLYPHNFSPEEDPLEVGSIGLPAVAGTYVWRSDFSAKGVKLKADKSGYETSLIANCAVKDWTFASGLAPQTLKCEYVQSEGSRLYFNLTGFLKAPDNNITSQLEQIPPVANVIEVEYGVGSNQK